MRDFALDNSWLQERSIKKWNLSIMLNIENNNIFKHKLNQINIVLIILKKNL